MGEFISKPVGLLRLHGYPDTRGGGAGVTFARNFATGPATAGIFVEVQPQLPWEIIDSGASPGVDVPITPRATGVVRIIGVVTVKNASINPVSVQVIVQIDGVNLPFPSLETVMVDAGGTLAIPILAEQTGLAIGVMANVEIQVSADTVDAITYAIQSSSVEVQEVPVATG